MPEAEIADEDIAEVKRIVLEGLRDFRVQIYFFGSGARGNTHRGSDIDLAVLPLDPLPREVLSEIREALEESSVPYVVDLVDLSQTDASFCATVLREGVPWSV